MIFKTITDETTLSNQRIVSVLQARKIAQEKASRSIQEHIAQLELDKVALTNLEEKIKIGISYEEAYSQSMNKASIAAKEHAVQTKGVAGTTDTFVAKQKVIQAELKATITSTKIANISIKALRTAFNMFSGISIMWGIDKITEYFRYLSQSAEKAQEKLSKIQTKLIDNSSSYKNNRKTLIGLQAEYDILVKKAESLGGVQNLANNEYERYKEITSQILEITPKLTTGWNDEGVAISNKNNLLQRSIGLLDEEYEKSLRNNTTKAENQDVAAGIIAKVSEFENNADTKTTSGTQHELVWEDLKQYVNEAVENGNVEYTYKNTGIIGHNIADAAYAINEFVYGDNLYEVTELNSAYGWLGSLQERILSSEESLKQFTESLSDTENPIYQWFTNEQIDELIRDSDAYFQECQRIIDDRETIFQDYKSQLNWNAQATNDKNGNNAYKQLSDESKAALTDYINNLDYTSVKTTNDFVEMANNVRNFTRLLASDDILANYIGKIYTPQNEDVTIEKYVEQVRNAINDIQLYCSENGITVPINFDDKEQSLNDLEAQYQNAIDYAKNNFDGYDPTIFFNEHSINTQEEIDAWQKIAQGAKDATQAEKEYIQNSTPSKTFDQAWSDSFTSEDETVRELGSNLLALAEQGRLTIETFNKADSTGYFKNLGISADEAVLKINKLVDESTQLSSISGQISAIAGALGTKQTDGFVSADTLSGFDAEIRGLESWDQFQAVLGSTASSYQDCQKAANALATEWVRSNDFLAQLTEGNKDYYETQLKAMGVENTPEVISDALSAKEALVLQDQILAAETAAVANNTNFSVAAFLSEAGATEITRACLFQLVTAEQVFNNTDLSTAEKIEKLKELATAYGQTAIAARIANMEKAEQDGHVPIDYEKELAALQNDINNAVGSVQIDFNGMNGATSHAAGAGKSAAKSYLEAFEEELSDLSQLRDNGVITEKEYLDSLRALYERYFANKLGYEKEYAKYQRQYLEGYKSLYESALSSISTLLGNQIDGYNDAKDAAISSLTQEKDARLEVIDAQKEQLEAQKDLIDEQIEAKQKLIDDIQNEIDAMKEANSERQRQLDLQKAQYELERMQHQRTILQYSEENGMQYVQNEEGLRAAKESVDSAKFEIEISNKEKNISLLEDEISLLEEQKDAIQNQMDLLDKQAEQVENYYSKMISETEAYYDSLINNMERQKSKWEEIAEIESVARAYSDLEQVAGGLGYSVQDILSGNEQAFEDFKTRYITLLSDLNNNSSFSEGLSYATSGIAEGLNNLETSAATVSESTGIIAANIGEVNTSAETLSGSLSNIGDALSGFSETDNITAATDAFSKLGQAIQSVADALNISEEGTIGSLTDALKSLCEMPLCETEDDGQNGGILSKFQALKTAVTDVTNAISGGGSSASADSDGGNSSSPSMSSGVAGNSSGGLVGAINSLKSAANDALGGSGNNESEEQSEGSGIIAQFGQLKDAVTDTAKAIGSGDSKQQEKSKGGRNGNLISSITTLGSTASEILTGDGNDEDKSGGVIGRFEQFKDVIVEANEHVTGIATGLHDIDGETVECTIKVNIEQNGELPSHAKGAFDSMNLKSGEYKAKHGRALAKGTGNNKGLSKAEKNALRSEYGQPELTVYPDGATELTTQPTISDLPRGTVVFNEAQTKEIFQNKPDTIGSVSSADTARQSLSGKLTLPPPQRPSFLVQQELQEECLAKTGSLMDKILSPLNMLSRSMQEMSGLTGNINHVSHNGQNQSVNVGGITITCPGVTSQEVARQVGTELNHIFSGFHNYADQQSRVRN